MTTEQIKARKDKLLDNFERASYVSRDVVEGLAEAMIQLGREIERESSKSGFMPPGTLKEVKKGGKKK
jgi:hypothetical protein